MTRYLLATWEGGGNVGPELAIAKRLTARGHEVRVIGDPASERAVRAAGCAVETVLRDPRYVAGARTIAEAIARDAQTIDPAALIEELTASQNWVPLASPLL
jgi:UDP:flavonoid glycosyltransferase YjiC (YdhE family)